MTTLMKKWVLPGIFLAVFTALSLSSSIQKSATWDETHYLGLGLDLFKNFRWNIPSVTLHPPLSYYLNSLPLTFFDIDLSTFQEGEPWDILSGVRRGQSLLKKSSPSGDRLLFWARLPSICLGVLLGIFVYRWALHLFGTGGALFSLFLYGLSPNLLAHTRLLTPDIALTTFGFIALYYFWKSEEHGLMKDLLLCGFFLGLTLLSKYSALLWIPVMILLSLMNRLFEPSEGSHPGALTGGAVVRLGFILGIALLIVLLGYKFQISYYFEGIQIQKRVMGEGFPAFLNGSVSRYGGWWYYYIMAFMMKVPIPLLSLLAVSCLLFRRIHSMSRFSAACLLFPVFSIVFAFSFLYKVNLGLRYILPIFPFLMILSGSLMIIWERKRHLWAFVLFPLALWYAYESLSIHPHYLAYFNQFTGGPVKGYLHLVDSNLDWGQDLKGLKAYMDRKGIKKVKLSYFGTSDPSQYGIDYDVLPSFVKLNRPSDSQQLKKGDILAISATNLYPIYVDLGESGEYLRRTSPIAQVGYSILIYQLDRDLTTGY